MCTQTRSRFRAQDELRGHHVLNCKLVPISAGAVRGHRQLSVFLSLVDFCVPPSLVAPGELSAAEVTGEGLLARVCTDVGREVVAPAKAAHADAALKRLVSGVDTDVTRELIRARKPPVASLGRTRIRALVHWSLARSVRVFPWPQYWPEWDILRVGAVYRWPWPVHWARQSKIPYSVQGSQRWRDSNRLQRARKWLDILKNCHVVPLAVAVLIKAPIVWNNGEKRPVYG